MITADGQRTMNTYLGACTKLGVSDVTPETFGKPKAVLIEGYVWDIAEGPALAKTAMELARKTRSTVALSLSDSFCVERHKASFAEAIREGVQIVIADEDEINALMGTSDFDDTLESIRNHDNLFVMTRSARGSVIVHRGEQHVQEATPVEKVIDTTGAGDAFCAGFLYGWVHDKSLAECARAGTLCATAVIQQVGARIEKGVMD
jgi:sugar/nucleoside kinase (ribokinase family)